MSLPEVKDTHYEDVEVGENIPSISIGPLSHTHFVFIASSHHDWYPGHHDVEYARKQGLPDIFMNATWQHALIQRLVCSWADPTASPQDQVPDGDADRPLRDHYCQRHHHRQAG